MDLSNLLLNLRQNAESSDPNPIRTKLALFNKENEGKFECQQSIADIREELVEILFKLAHKFSSVLNDKAVERSVALALKEVLTCIRILSRMREVAVTIGSNGKLVDGLAAIASIKLRCDDNSMNESEEENKTQLVNDAEVEAVKIVCNCVFHSQEFRRHFAKSRCTKLVTQKLDSLVPKLGSEKELCCLLIKALFLISALDIDERERMRVEYKTDEVLINILAEVLKIEKESVSLDSLGSKGVSENQKANASTTLVIELLKALFNVTVNVADASLIEEQACKNYCSLSQILHQYLTETRLASVLPKALVGHLANMLINIPKGCLQGLLPPVKRRPWQEQIPKFKGMPSEFELKDVSAVITLISCLDDELKQTASVSDDESHVFSILSCLCHICRCLRVARKYLRYQLLPPLKDARARPETEESVKGRLIKLMTSPDTNVKNMAADFLFVLCKEDPDRLVKHTGYGNAAGLLAGRGLMGRKSVNRTGDYSSDDDDSETEEYSAIAGDIDPITGAVSSKSKVSDPSEGMTEEEKEASASELIDLLDRMSSLDMIKPMRIGENGMPEVFDVKEAKKLVNENLKSDS